MIGPRIFAHTDKTQAPPRDRTHVEHLRAERVAAEACRSGRVGSESERPPSNPRGCKKPKRLRLTFGAFRGHSRDEHGLVAYRIDLGSYAKLLPAVRYEWLDADIARADRGVFAQPSGALSVIFLDRVRVVLDVTAIDVQTTTPVLNQPKPLATEPYLALDQLRGTVQVQLEL